MSNRGAIAALERKIQKFSDTGKLLARAREAMAKEAVRLTSRGFATSTAPSGRRWAPLKYRTGKPLVLTGQLSKFTYRVTSKGFVVYAGAEYFEYHQYGTKKMVARPMVPNSLSWGTWAKPMVEAGRRSIARWFK